MNDHTDGAPHVVVTGATGFTGGRLVRRLVREGRRVTALVRPDPDGRKRRRSTVLELEGVTAVDCDLTSREDVQRAFRAAAAPDVVYHVAAAFRQQHADFDYFRRANVEATRYLVDSALETGAPRFVHCSTVGVQGEIDDPPADEDYRVKPGDVYQQSKLEGERVALAGLDRGLPVAVIRPVGIYGPGDHRFLKLFRAIVQRKMIVVGSGDTLYHLTHVDDVVQGLLLAGRVDTAVGEAFTIAGERYTTLNELFAIIADAADVPPPKIRIPYRPMFVAAWLCDRACRAVGVEPPLYPRRVEFFSKDRAFTIEKARRLLGYEPSIDLETGIAETYEWYRQEGLLGREASNSGGR